MSNENPTAANGEEIAAEACQYLDALETFAALDADPHADARARAARERAVEDEGGRPQAAAERRSILRWAS